MINQVGVLFLKMNETKTKGKEGDIQTGRSNEVFILCIIKLYFKIYK